MADIHNPRRGLLCRAASMWLYAGPVECAVRRGNQLDVEIPEKSKPDVIGWLKTDCCESPALLATNMVCSLLFGISEMVPKRPATRCSIPSTNWRKPMGCRGAPAPIFHRSRAQLALRQWAGPFLTGIFEYRVASSGCFNGRSFKQGR